jgi:ketosteroid isomerase-like protein
VRLVLAVASAVALSVPVGAQQAPDARAEVRAVADSALAAISRKDFPALAAMMLDEGRTFSVREREGQIRYASRTRAEQAAGTFEGTIAERGFDPVVHVSGALAVVWMPYDLYRNGTWSHCGVDAFTLLRVEGRWRIATMAWSVEQPPACAKHPAGPPQP